MAEREIHIPTSTEVPHYNATVQAYQAAFAGYPWFEELSHEEIQKRIAKDVSRTGFSGVWLSQNDTLVGASWYYEMTLEELRKEKGDGLAGFAIALGDSVQASKIVWQSMTLVAPDFQGQGVGTALKESIFNQLENYAQEVGPLVYLTRIRDDNYGSQKMNLHYGLERTGIKVASSQVEGLMHEYWYKVIVPVQSGNE